MDPASMLQAQAMGMMPGGAKLSGIGTKIANIVTKFSVFIQEFQMTMASAGIIFVVLLIGYVVMKTLYNQYPRFGFPSHTENLESIDNEFVVSTAKALAYYLSGFELENVLLNKSSHEHLNLPAGGLKQILDTVNRQLNFHKEGRLYSELAGLVERDLGKNALKNIPQMETYFRKKLTRPYEKTTDRSKKQLENARELYEIVLRNHADVETQLNYINDNSLLNFIDFEAYEKDTPQNDRTIIFYGKLANIRSRTMLQIFKQLPEPLSTKLSSSENEINAFIEKITKYNVGVVTDFENLRTLLFERTKGKVTEEIYNQHIRQYKRGVYDLNTPEAIDYPIREKFCEHIRLLDENILAPLRRLRSEQFQSLDGNLFRGLQTDVYFALERLLEIQYDLEDGSGIKKLLTEEETKKFSERYLRVISNLQYQLYPQQINHAIFTVLYLYYAFPSNFLKQMQVLSEFYMSFNELYFFKRFEAATKLPRKWRLHDKDDTWTNFQELIVEEYYCIYIYEKLARKTWPLLWRFDVHFRKAWGVWQSVYKKLMNPETYIPGVKSKIREQERAVQREKAVADKSRNQAELFTNGSDLLDKTPQDLLDTGKKMVNTAVETGKEIADQAIDTAVEVEKTAREKLGQTAKEKRPVIETFLGFDIADFVNKIISILVNIPKIIADVLGLLPKVFELVLLASNPLQLVMGLIGVVVWIVMTVVANILNIGDGESVSIGSFMVMLGLYIKTLPVIAGKTIYNVLMYTIMLFFGLILTVLDATIFNGKASSFVYRRFMASENSPYSWYKKSNYHYKNRFERQLGLFTAWPCPSSYRPAYGGMVCKRLPSYIPKKCPQASIVSIAKGDGTSGATFISDSMPYTDFGQMSKNEKYKLVEEVRQAKSEYQTACTQNYLKFYDPISKNVCSNLEITANTSQDRKNLKAVCKQTYCTNGRQEPFCYRLNQFAPTEETKKNFVSKRNIFTQAFMITSIVMIISAVMWYAKQNAVLRFTLKPAK
jgi:hypothetical protein